MTTFTFEQTHQLLQSFLDRPKSDAQNPLTLAQRTLNRKRGQQIANYVIKGLADSQGFYILPPIIVTLDTPEGTFFEFDSIELEDGPIENMGILRVPDETQFFIPDGQHRAFASTLAHLQAPGLIKQEAFGVMLIPDTGGKKQRQIFLDTNQHTVKPSKSIISLFDHRDEYSEFARTILTQVPIFTGRTSLEATNIPPRSGDLFTMNSLRESTKTLLANYRGADPEKVAISFWAAISKHHPAWKLVEGCEDLPSLRQSTIAFNALTLNAIALVANQHLAEKSRFAWMKKLSQIDWTVNNPAWDGVCRFNGRIVKNSTTTKALAEYILEGTK